MWRPCTVIAASQFAHARVLDDALRATGASRPLTVLVLDGHGSIGTTGDEVFEVLHLRDLPSVRDPRLFSLRPRDLAEVAKPMFLQRLLDEGGADLVLLEPELDLHDALTDVADLARDCGIVLVPRLLEPLPNDGARPTESEVLAGGQYRSGLLAVGDTDEGRRFVDWWAERPWPDASDRKQAAAAIDLTPALFPSARVLRDPGHGVAYWNLPARPLDKDGELVTAAGRPLRSLYFEGFDPEKPYWLSDDNTRVRVTDDELLTELCTAYSERLLAADHAEAAALPWGFGTLANGVPINDDVRLLLAEAVASGEELADPFEPDGTQRFMAWLMGPAERGGSVGVSRYLFQIYRRRPDLQDAFPNLDGPDADRFMRWARADGRLEEGISELLLPTEAAEAMGGRRAAFGVNVAGYLSGGLGLGEAARLYVTALQAAGVPVRTESVDPPLPPAQRIFGVQAARKRMAYEELGSAVDYPLNLVCVNAPELPGFVSRVGPEFFAGRRTVGVWAWETSFIPEDWDTAYRHLDEIWTYTTYTASVLAQRAPVPVVSVPLPVMAPTTIDPQLELELPEGFRFLFAFDFFSTIQRKNPIGLVEAFKRAFAPREGPQLVLKSFNGDYKPEHLERLRYAVRGRPDIHIVDRFLATGQRNALMASADCYVSLHRSEGFGLTLAEAMVLGKPVIATGYSGNLDFMNSRSAYLVDYELTRVGPGVEIYPADGLWAEPDLDQAAEFMRHVVQYPEEASERAARGKERVEEQLSPSACGRIARDRLERLASAPEPEGRSLARDRDWQALGRAAAKAGFDPVAAAAGRDPRQVARRSVLQAMRPYTFHQRELNEHIVDALRELHLRNDEADERTGEADERIAGLAWTLGRLGRSAELRAGRLDARLQELEAPVQRLERLGRDLERAAEGVRARPASNHPLLLGADASGRKILAFGEWNSADVDGYSGFEDIFRGNESDISRRLEFYLPTLAGHAPVLDLGCGRGELLGLLAAACIDAHGIDIDEGMVERCRAKELSAERGDAVDYLRSLDDSALGAVSAIQLVEHLPYDVLTESLSLIRQKLKPGGRLIAETVNPHAAPALKAFWTDPTHQHPLFPEVLLTLCRLAGYASGRIVFPGGTGVLDEDVYECRDYSVIATA